MPVVRFLAALTRVLVLAAALFWAVASAGSAAAAADSGLRVVVFNYSDAAARTVCIAGSFNGWSATTHCMARSGARWSLRVELEPGRYEYVLVRNGSDRLLDPGAQGRSDSGFGQSNSVLYVD